MSSVTAATQNRNDVKRLDATVKAGLDSPEWAAASARAILAIKFSVKERSAEYRRLLRGRRTPVVELGSGIIPVTGLLRRSDVVFLELDGNHMKVLRESGARYLIRASAVHLPFRRRAATLVAPYLIDELYEDPYLNHRTIMAMLSDMAKTGSGRSYVEIGKDSSLLSDLEFMMDVLTIRYSVEFNRRTDTVFIAMDEAAKLRDFKVRGNMLRFKDIYLRAKQRAYGKLCRDLESNDPRGFDGAYEAAKYMAFGATFAK